MLGIDTVDEEYVDDDEEGKYLHDVYVVELPVKEHSREDVQEAIQGELRNMDDYGVFGEKVKLTNQEVVGTRMVITESEKHDGQKTNVKARLVGQGFKKQDKAQSDSPTAERESLRLFLSISAKRKFNSLSSIDIRATFLQSENLER